jgi:multidrug resistance efflux pump
MKIDYELRKLKRVDLLEMLLEQSKELEQVKAELEQAQSKLHSRKILLDNAGSIAEATVQLNEIFAVAQKTADQYLDNVQRIQAESQAQAQQMLEETRKICTGMLSKANDEAMQDIKN